MLITIQFALIAVLVVLGTTTDSTEFKEPAQFNNVTIESPKQLEASELLQPRQELEPIVEESLHRKSVSVPQGSHQDWMAAAGIAPQDYTYVEFIISRESGWRPDAVNSSSGACSLVQALPCSKIQGDWKNPVVALKWQKDYVTQRYGGYANAYNFWVKNHWY